VVYDCFHEIGGEWVVSEKLSRFVIENDAVMLMWWLQRYLDKSTMELGRWREVEVMLNRTEVSWAKLRWMRGDK